MPGDHRIYRWRGSFWVRRVGGERVVAPGVERKLEIVGEALKHAEDEDATVATRIPGLRSIVGLRNRIIHGYDAVDDEIVWDIVQSKLPALAAQLELVLGERDEDES